MKVRSLARASALLTLAACGVDLSGVMIGADDDASVPGSEAGVPDTGTDAVTPSPDASPDRDGGTNPPPDATAKDSGDAGKDTGFDAPVDAPIDTGTDSGPLYPVSCAEIPAATNTDVTLYWDRDPAKPYDAHCGNAGATFVKLNDNAAKNTSSYPLGTQGCTSLVGGQTKPVTTTWTMLRFDPATKLVNTGDYSYATLSGGTHEESGNGTFKYDYLKMPFASGRVCDDHGNFAAVAKIDLSKTKLAVAGSQAWSHDGFQGQSSANADGKNKVITLNVAGYSAGVSPCAANVDYYTQNGGFCLQLAYAP